MRVIRLRNQGYSLVELLIVVVILGILIGIATLASIRLMDVAQSVVDRIAGGIHVITANDGIHLSETRNDGILYGTYTGNAERIMIPGYFNGEIVKEIWQDVFNPDNGATKVTSVIFAGDSQLESIGRRAFRNTSFSQILFPSTLKTIGDMAFRNNHDLTRIVIGANVTIGNNAFHRDNTFRDAYEIGGAGTYLFTNGNWIKQ